MTGTQADQAHAAIETVIRLESARLIAGLARYAGGDIGLAEELGRHLAIAIRVDRVFRQRSQVAEALQASLLPRSSAAKLVHHQFRHYYSAHDAQSFAAQVWTNNAVVAAETITLGVLLGIPVLLVGDSAAMVVYGHDSTIPVTVDELIPLTAAVVRGTRRALVVADLPFGSYQISAETAMATAIRFLKETGAHAVKLEGGHRVLRCVEELVAAGIRAGVNAAPILPGLTDSPAQLDRLARAASEHGARFLLPMMLFLMPSAMAQFMPFLEKEYPQLVRRYRKLFRHSAYLSDEYKDGISKLVAELRTRYGLDGRREETTVAPLHRQYALAFG